MTSRLGLRAPWLFTLAIYITELDIGPADDSQQATVMKNLVTTFWNDPNVLGITYWGYIVGKTWRSNTGLMQSDGARRPASTVEARLLARHWGNAHWLASDA